jgi:hypothetical protein
MANDSEAKKTPEQLWAERNKQVMADQMSLRKEAEDRIRLRQAERARKKVADEARDAIAIAIAREIAVPKPVPNPRKGTLHDAIKQAGTKIWPDRIPGPERLKPRDRNDAINKEIAGAGFKIPNLGEEIKARDTAIRRAVKDQMQP